MVMLARAVPVQKHVKARALSRAQNDGINKSFLFDVFFPRAVLASDGIQLPSAVVCPQIGFVRVFHE